MHSAQLEKGKKTAHSRIFLRPDLISVDNSDIEKCIFCTVLNLKKVKIGPLYDFSDARFDLSGQLSLEKCIFFL